MAAQNRTNYKNNSVLDFLKKIRDRQGLGSGSGGSITIGSPVTGGSANQFLYEDGSGNLAEGNTSAELAAIISDKTGTAGSLVFSVSPTFTGTPSAPTAALNNGSTQLATTQYVLNDKASMLTTANEWLAAQIIRIDNLLATVVAGLTLENTTPAVNSVGNRAQVPPALYFLGRHHNGTASVITGYRLRITQVTSTSTQTSFNLDYTLDGTTFTNVFSISSQGSSSILGSLSVSSGMNAATGSFTGGGITMTSGGPTVALQPPPTGSSYTVQLPSAQGGNNSVLLNDGAGILSWGSLTTFAISTKTSDYVMSPSDYTILVDTTAGDCAVTFPDPATVPGQVFIIKKITAANDLIYAAGNGRSIDGVFGNIVVATQWFVVRVQSDGTDYFVI